MKYLFSILSIFLLASSAVADDSCHPPVSKRSTELERLKGLEGKWEGSASTDGKPQSVGVTYHTTAGGTAVIETLFPGTPHEMISVYHDENGKLSATHYCAMGNQPRFDVTSSNAREINFNLAPTSKIEAKEPHMHALNIAFVDENTIIQNWTGYKNGEPDSSTTMKFKRVK